MTEGVKRASSVRRRMRSAGRPTSSAPTGRPECLAATTGGQPQRRGRGHGARVGRGGAGEQGGQPHLVPQVEVVVGGGPVGPEADPHAAVEEVLQRGDARPQLSVGARAVRHGDVVPGDDPEVGLVEPHRVRRQHAALEDALGLQEGGCAHAVARAAPGRTRPRSRRDGSGAGRHAAAPPRRWCAAPGAGRCRRRGARTRGGGGRPGRPWRRTGGRPPRAGLPTCSATRPPARRRSRACTRRGCPRRSPPR